MPGLNSLRSFAVYYGPGGEDQLAAYDLAVIDPGGRTVADISRIKRNGGLALAYLSVLEVPQQTGRGAPDAVLMDGRKPVINRASANWVLDPRSAVTTERARGLAVQLMERGYDGLFLDTVADVEDLPLSAELAAEVLPAVARLVADLSRIPGRLVVQNRGLHRLLPLTAPHLSGVCWEAFPFARIGAAPDTHSGVRALQRLSEGGLGILALNEGITSGPDARAAKAAAARCGFVWYGARRYTDLPSLLRTR